MSQPQSEQNPENQAAPPQAQNVQPPPNPPQNPFHQRAQAQQAGGDFSPLLDAINALPERLVNAVRESAPQPPAPVVNPPQQAGNAATGQQGSGEAGQPGSGASGKQGSEESPRKKTFAEKWFTK